MTVLNFPSTAGKPTDGSFQYIANGVVYSWDGEKWVSNTQANGGGGGRSEPVHFDGPDAPDFDSLIAGDQWYNTNDGRLYTYTLNDSNDLVWVDASPDSQVPQFWERTGTTLEPTNDGDDISVGAGTFSGRITAEAATFSGTANSCQALAVGTKSAFVGRQTGGAAVFLGYDSTDPSATPKLTLNAAGNAYFTRADGFNPEGAADWGQRAAIRTNGSFGGGIALIDGQTTNSPGYCIWLNDSGANLNIGGKANQSGGLGGAGVALAGHAATSWTTRSDERDKENLVEITDGLNKVGMLRAVTGNFIEEIDPTKTKKAFLIAQDVLEVQPEAVSSFNTNEKVENQRYGIAYTEVIPLLVSALHDAKDRIEDLEAKVQQLEGGNN